MKRKPTSFLTTGEAGAICGLRSSTVWRFMQRYPTFGIKMNNHRRIPRAHIDRLLAGETVAEIAANPSFQTALTGEAA
jgi:hypothetical protein